MKKRTEAVKNKQRQPKILLPYLGYPRQNMPKSIAFELKDYCELVGTTSRCIRNNKARYIDNSHSPTLEWLGLDLTQWLTLTTVLSLSTVFEKDFCYAAGAE